MKVPTEFPADLDYEAMKVWKRERADELGVHCHLRFATSGTEQLMISSSVYMQPLYANCFNYKTALREKLEA